MKYLMTRVIKKILLLISSTLKIFKNIIFLHLFIKDILILKKNIFQISNGAIGHFPLSIFFAIKFYGKNSIFFYKKNVKNANEYLEKKINKNYCFDQKYSNVHEIMTSLKNLSFGCYNFSALPEHMHMGKKMNFSKAFQNDEKLFEFNLNENKEGNLFLEKNKIKKEKYICFLVRTEEYNKVFGNLQQAKSEDSKRKFLNVNSNSYILSLKYLVNSGYSVVRMGKGFSNKFPFEHENFFDYAVSEDRSDFLDIWLSANCKFFFGTTNGIITLASVFNKPFLGTNTFPVGTISSYLPNSVHLPRLVKKNNKFLKLKDQVKLDIIRQVNGIYFDEIGIDLIENDEKEILDAVKDIEIKINSGFYVNKLNMQFWKNLQNNWSEELIPANSAIGQGTFDDYHKISDIRTTIPDFYLKKYEEVFIDK